MKTLSRSRRFRSVLALACFASCGAIAFAASAEDYLLVRTRAGLSESQRQRILFEAGKVEVGRIEALNVSRVRPLPTTERRAYRSLGESVYVSGVEAEERVELTVLPLEAPFDEQWGLRRVRAPGAWEVTQGAGVVVAILDTGVDLEHPALQPVLRGMDIHNQDPDPSDDHGHGTQMAGIVAARLDSGPVVGVAPRASILPVKVLGGDGVGSYGDVAQGIVYAVDHGARIVSMSLAGNAPSAVLQSAVDYALARGSVVVAAAGNAGSDTPAYPAACQGVISVVASDESDLIARFSNHGSWVDLAAPGVGILSTHWRGGGYDYGSVSGTSPATAFVAAVAALRHAALGGNPAQIETALANVALDLPPAGWDPYSGWGRVDAEAGVRYNGGASPTPTPSPVSPTVVVPSRDRKRPVVRIAAPIRNSLWSSAVPVDVVATDDVGVVRVVLSLDGADIASSEAAPFSFVWEAGSATPGKHRLMAKAYDAAGNWRLSKAVIVFTDPYRKD